MSFPLVGIGASAGGLESISALLAGIPASTGMAYVFAQHLDPGHVSHLAKILSNRAALPVEQAREGEIFPDHLYVIIPNTTLTITSNILHLRSRDPTERPHRHVDTLLWWRRRATSFPPKGPVKLRLTDTVTFRRPAKELFQGRRFDLRSICGGPLLPVQCLNNP
jgi:hypothetical protein